MTTWEQVLDRLADARIWWVATAHPVRGPHTVPVWGVVVRGACWTYGDDDGRRLRDLAEDGRAVVHLESGTDVLLVRGTFSDEGDPATHPDVCAAFAAKYADEAAYLPDAPGRSGTRLQSLTPTSVRLWSAADDYTTERVSPGGAP